MAAQSTITVHAVTPLAGYRQATASEVKEFGEKNGFKVNAGRGRMALDLVHAFNKANKRRKVQYVTGTGQSTRTQEYAFTTAAGRESKFTAVPSEVRAWAKEQGLTVGERGRFTQEVRNAYGQAHAKVRAPRKPKAQADAGE